MSVTGSSERSATYRDVFELREFRALFAAQALSLVGDQLAKVALSVLVYAQTGSALLAAVTFAISYVPNVLGGPLLSALADRFPRRRMMVVCDLVRAGLVALLAIPGVPLGALLAIIFVAELCSPPFNSARAAILPEVLTGDRYVVGMSVTHMTYQGCQVAGFAVGGALVAILTARGSLLIDALTFLLSAVLLALFVRERPFEREEGHGSVLGDTAQGLRLVLGNRTLLALVLMFWLVAGAVASPEGLAAPYARHLHGDAVVVGLLLAANPAGYFVGALVFGRFVTPATRRRMVRLMALLACVPLVLLAADPGLPVVLGLLAVSGFGLAYNLPLNQMFVVAVPPSYRGRAVGVAVTGQLAVLSVGTFLAGAAADRAPVPYVVAACGLAGLLAAVALSLRWPSEQDMLTPVPAPTTRPYPAVDPAQQASGRHRA